MASDQSDIVGVLPQRTVASHCTGCAVVSADTIGRAIAKRRWTIQRKWLSQLAVVGVARCLQGLPLVPSHLAPTFVQDAPGEPP